MSYDLSNNLLSAPTPIPFSNCCIGFKEIPLNLLAYILSYVTDAKSLAACCATSKLLYYMALPALYRNITLTSHSDTRSKHKLAEHTPWRASPFCMGLNALVTRKTAALVRSLHLRGEWRENNKEHNPEYSRVSDTSVLLSIATRAIVDRCVHLQSFRWTLYDRPMSMLYAGLADLKNLRALYIRLSSDETPQTPAVVPALPQLRQFGFTEYDAKCCPDDFSLMLASARDLEVLSMHFSLRMRNSNESASFLDLFHRNVMLKRPLRLRSLAIYNIVSNPTPEVHEILLQDHLEELTLLNSIGSVCTSEKSQVTHSFDQSWVFQGNTRVDTGKIKIFRSNKINQSVVKDLTTMPNLDRIYLVNASPPKMRTRSGLQSPATSQTSDSDGATPIGPPLEPRLSAPRLKHLPHEILRDSLIDTIDKIHGSKLKHIILSSRLPLNVYNIARLCASCPNLTQLAFAMEDVSPEALRHIGPSARELKCCRILAPDGPGVEGKEQRKRWDEFEARKDHDYYFELEFSGVYGNDPLDAKCLRYIGLGQKVWEVGNLHWESKMIRDENGDEMEQRIYERTVKAVTLKDVEDIEIWKYDTLDPV